VSRADATRSCRSYCLVPSVHRPDRRCGHTWADPSNSTLPLRSPRLRLAVGTDLGEGGQIHCSDCTNDGLHGGGVMPDKQWLAVYSDCKIRVTNTEMGGYNSTNRCLFFTAQIVEERRVRRQAGALPRSRHHMDVHNELVASGDGVFAALSKWVARLIITRRCHAVEMDRR
jgi:hypothetical protein